MKLYINVKRKLYLLKNISAYWAYSPPSPFFIVAFWTQTLRYHGN